MKSLLAEAGIIQGAGQVFLDAVVPADQLDAAGTGGVLSKRLFWWIENGIELLAQNANAPVLAGGAVLF